MRTLRLISTAAAILLLGAGAVSAQNIIKTDETPGAPAAKSEPNIAPEKTGRMVPKAPESANKQQTTDKAAPAGDAAKVSSDADRSANVKSKQKGTSCWRPICGRPSWTAI